ncbi:ABC transporter ATP-binding protein [Thorsellia anophelis]|uniref:Putative spermidine/putrescine transport system ATP-binding protein n=1 Tax=Thorsellia anophelis DSM 18579 TaxID=1123402 RepID=A0A1I0FWM6_9GAMM|nr:ABC transporter ATP-binding protein [Thorsellia anophelis]SET62902.1 putative spermidine/putrescine transport system ATP-binding protein [Thorsellia anophelis DSM 18579]
MTIFFEAKNLKKSYWIKQTEQPILNNLSFEVYKGEFITLLGQSGCGKSTLLRAIAGLTNIDSGELYVEGECITHRSIQKRGIGMVFQHYALFPNLSVFDNVAYGLKIAKCTKAECAKRVNEILELVDLLPHASKYPHQLSGGQRQRVALARAVVMMPRLLLLDEPLSALDAPIRKRLREQIKKIQSALNLTTLFVTHDQEEAMALSDRIFLMDNGQFVQQGKPELLYTRPETRSIAAFIGHYNILEPSDVSKLFNHSTSKYIAIRPESIYIEDHTRLFSDTLSEAFRAKVISVQLLGNIIRYQVEVNQVQLKLDTLNRGLMRLVPVGSELLIRFNFEECIEVA